MNEQEFDVTQKMQKMERADKSIPTICSRCGKIYKINKWLIDEGRKIGVSHGYCESCFEIVKSDLERGDTSAAATMMPSAAEADRKKAAKNIKALYLNKKKKKSPKLRMKHGK